MRSHRSGFRLLAFHIPLGKFEEINITTAVATPSNVKRFSALQDFIDWYENQYLPNRITTEQIIRASIIPFADPKVEKERLFCKQYDELKINIEAKFDPFPFFRSCETIFPPSKDEILVSTVLYNGLSVRVPMDDYRKWVLLLNTNVFYASKSNKWEDFLYYLGIGVVDNEEDNMHRLTPTDTYVGYAKDSDEEVQIIMNHYNGHLNKDYPFEYPDNWFKVIKELMRYRGGLVGVSGEVIAAYMFAAPRTYLKYFTSDKSDKQIAEDIYYDNL